MRKKAGPAIFVVVAMALCLVPFAGMVGHTTEETTENRKLAEWPSLWVESSGQNVAADGNEGQTRSLNRAYFSQVSDYFNDHFFLRNQLIASDAGIMSKVFHTSSVSTILTGDNNWLYYTDSLDDYLGTNLVSQRGAYNIAHNLSIVGQTLAGNDVQFLFTIAPNKNSLYDENMPYYYRVKANQENNLFRTLPYLTECGVPYADLYAAFQAQPEVLYRAQDSHWNEKGAVLAYNTILDALQKDHNDYSGLTEYRRRVETGDLANSLYSIAAKPEWNYYYDQDETFEYKNMVADPNSESGQRLADNWENDARIETGNASKSGRLLMFRDSFGNTLSPLMAGEYNSALFLKANVYNLDKNLYEFGPDTVIFEIVERNLERFGRFAPNNQMLYGPPIMGAPLAGDVYVGDAEDHSDSQSTLQFIDAAGDQNYQILYGSVDEKYLDDTTEIYVEIQDAGFVDLYQAYTVSLVDDQTGNISDNGYMMYLAKDYFQDPTSEIRIFTRNSDGQVHMVFSNMIDHSEQ